MILLILTGGTIGSCVTADGTINTGRSRLLEMYSRLDGAQDFEVLRPIDVLSENIGLPQWTSLINTLDGVDPGKYEGIVITHGSDTLAYTSALIAMLYADAGLPICLIAADHPLEYPNSNGIDNLSAAISVIKSGTNGVFTVYADSHGDKSIPVYHAARLMEADTYLDRFSSYGGEHFGTVENGIFVRNKKMPASGGKFGKSIKIGEFKNKVLFIRPYPAIDYTAVNTDGFAAVVHYSYHAGTACADTLSAFVKSCVGDVWFGSLKTLDASLYASSDSLLKSGIRPLFNISPYAMYMKALIAYNQSIYPPGEIMTANLGGEVLPAKG